MRVLNLALMEVDDQQQSTCSNVWKAHLREMALEYSFFSRTSSFCAQGPALTAKRKESPRATSKPVESCIRMRGDEERHSRGPGKGPIPYITPVELRGSF